MDPDPELRSSSWLKITNEAYRVATDILTCFARMNIPKAGWVGRPDKVSPDMGNAERTEITERIAREHQDMLENVGAAFAHTQRLFTKMKPLLDITKIDLPAFTLPGYEIDYSWFEGKGIVTIPECRYELAWQAISHIKGSISFWNIGISKAYWDSSQTLQKKRLTHEESKLIERYDHRRGSRPVPQTIHDAISYRLRLEQARIRKDFMAFGHADCLPIPPGMFERFQIPNSNSSNNSAGSESGASEENEVPAIPKGNFTKTQDRLVRAIWNHANWQKSQPVANISDVVFETWADEERESTSLAPAISRLHDRCSEQNPPILLTLRIRNDQIEIDYRAEK